MSREAASRCQLRDAIVPHIYQDSRNGTPAFGQSDLSINVAGNGPARIFIVEDDPVMLRMVGDYLEQHNMRAVSASGRQEMVHHFAVAEPDLVVLDLRLGQEDGFDLLREIRSRSDVPIIITTGDRRDEIDRGLSGWNWAPTTMSQSRLAFGNFWRASAPCCDDGRLDARCLAWIRSGAGGSSVGGNSIDAPGVSPTLMEPRSC
jgi:CheY-like chemotaxis protein